MKFLSCRTAGIALMASMVMGLALAQPADGTAYPTKPIRLVLTFPPGGSSDAVIRIISPALSKRLGQPVIVDNRPGAGGGIGLGIVAKADPDGYTLGVGAAGGLAANVSLYPKLSYDPIKSFAPISLLAHIPFVLVAHPLQPEVTLSQLITQARNNPGKFSIGHGGTGTAMHLSVQLFKQMVKADIVEIGYKGSGPAAVDVLGGQVSMAMLDLPSALQHIKLGKLRALAVTGSQRLADLPDVPTFAEAGVPGYESTGWFGLVAPAGTPPAVVARVQAELKAVLETPEVRADARAVGVELTPTSSAEFGKFIQSEIVKWGNVIKTSGTRLE